MGTLIENWLEPRGTCEINVAGVQLKLKASHNWQHLVVINEVDVIVVYLDGVKKIEVTI